LLKGNCTSGGLCHSRAAADVKVQRAARKTLRTTGVGYVYIGSRTNTTQQSGQTPDKEVEIKNITVYVKGYTETDTTGMLSPTTVWLCSVAADINSNVFDFYFLIWSLSRLLCCVGSGFNVAAAVDGLESHQALSVSQQYSMDL
jgi:hypothetical protein